MGIKEELEEKFKGKNVQVTLYPSTDAVKFTTLQEFHDYMVKERDYWAGCNDGRPGKVRSHFDSIVANLDGALNNGDPSQRPTFLDQAIGKAQLNQFPCVYSVSPIAKFVRDKYREDRQCADAMCEFLFQNSITQVTQKSHFEGYLYAFLTTRFDKAMSEKLGAEEQSLLDLRSRFVEEMNSLHRDYLTRGEECLRKSEEISGTYNSFCKETTDWRSGIQQNADDLLEEKRLEMEELKKLYNEKLRLESPAKYWSDLAGEYQAKGKSWRLWAVASSSLFLLFLVSVLYNLPDALFPGKGVTMTGFKSTLLLAFMASVGVYVIHLFVKLSLSAYHLSSDAKERYQLTHVYLSLVHEGAVSTEERAIVLQSIFSRADTGLLKGDSSPTLPDGIVGGITKNLKGH